jgi:hypothetical protein
MQNDHQTHLREGLHYTFDIITLVKEKLRTMSKKKNFMILAGGLLAVVLIAGVIAYPSLRKRWQAPLGARESGTAFGHLLADLPTQDSNLGGGAAHHHCLGVEAALVQTSAPIIELAEDIDIALGGAGAVVVENEHVGHGAE